MITCLRDFIRTLNFPCREHTELLSRQLDAPLPRGQAFALRLHLLYCSSCRRFKTQVRRLRELARTLGTELGPDAALPDDVRQRIALGIHAHSDHQCDHRHGDSSKAE